MPLPLGLKLHSDTLQLLGCEISSVAADNEDACACIGMVLLKVNGTQVRRPQDVAVVAKGCTLMTLLFSDVHVLAQRV